MAHFARAAFVIVQLLDEMCNLSTPAADFRARKGNQGLPFPLATLDFWIRPKVVILLKLNRIGINADLFLSRCLHIQLGFCAS